MNRDKVKLIWVQADNIIDLLVDPCNVDLRRMYFSNVREVDLLNDTVSVEEKTFLNSEDFFNLRLNNNYFTELAPSLLNIDYLTLT